MSKGEKPAVKIVNSPPQKEEHPVRSLTVPPPKELPKGPTPPLPPGPPKK